MGGMAMSGTGTAATNGLGLSDTLRKILPIGQRRFFQYVLANIRCEDERAEYKAMLDTAETQARVFEKMPKTYEQDAKGDKAVAYLHYFSPGGDWWITEKDSEPEQLQAFGLVKLFETELGYISLEELCSVPLVELDFNWKPKTLAEIRAKIGE